jgi:hypothetical protein
LERAPELHLVTAVPGRGHSLGDRRIRVPSFGFPCEERRLRPGWLFRFWVVEIQEETPAEIKTGAVGGRRPCFAKTAEVEL